MPLKKPSDYFNTSDTSTVNENIKIIDVSTELDTFSDAFDSFKNNLSKIELLSDFSNTLDNYRINIERVNHISNTIDEIKLELSNAIKKEDLERTMVSQLIVVEQSIRDVQDKVKGINERNLSEIKSDISNLSNDVFEFLEVEIPKYKKLVFESEIRASEKYSKLEKNIHAALDQIDLIIEEKYEKWLVDLVAKHFQVSTVEAIQYIEIYYLHDKSGLRKLCEKYGIDSKTLKKVKLWQKKNWEK